ncbi:phage holin family protein [Rheinheimera salexigens]|uniref:Uncharacterized protein n=1 Tax=Rheinheimera salexigens TaxID=1628148 RepID=A0A1E7Q4H8_9GAMM|nr:phage holin family protein [Rheinheimera salexigens]OEY69102.1 hypothetical protein BI198_05565 [Rheinheimera salexigens]
MQDPHIQQTPEQHCSETENTASNTKAAGLLDNTLDDIAEIAALASSVAQQYKVQTDLVKQQAKAEWALSVRSLTIAAAILVCFGAGVVMLWGSVLTLIGVVLFQLFNSLIASVVILLVLQILALIWCWRSMRYLLKQVGLKRTLLQISQFFSPSRFTKSAEQPESSNQRQAAK